METYLGLDLGGTKLLIGENFGGTGWQRVGQYGLCS